MLQLLTTMLFSGGLLLAAAVIGAALSRDAHAIRRALGLMPAAGVVSPLPPRYRVATARRAPPAPLPSATEWREAA